MPKRRILLHPGFHKTGTSSIQHFFWSNREKLAPHVHLFMLRHLKPVTQLTHSYSRSGNPLTLIDLAERLDEVFADTPDDTRDILISCEALCGHLPGWPKVKTYQAAPVILTYVTGYLRDRFDAEVEIVVTTRDPEPWLYSAYRHHLKGQRLTLDPDAFAAKYAKAADFAPIISAIATQCGPTRTLPLETASLHPLGPGGALLDMFGIPTDGFTPVGKGNEGPSDTLWREFLTLNRSDLTDAPLVNAKDALAKQSNLGGWRTGDVPKPAQLP